MVRRGSAKAVCVGSIPTLASSLRSLGKRATARHARSKKPQSPSCIATAKAAASKSLRGTKTGQSREPLPLRLHSSVSQPPRSLLRRHHRRPRRPPCAPQPWRWLTGCPLFPSPDLGVGTSDLIWFHSSSLRSVGYLVGCVCIHSIYDIGPMLRDISNLLRIAV